jgi:hypothetical protein
MGTNPPEVWQPKPGDRLIGVFVGIKRHVGPKGLDSQVLLRDEAGKFTAIWLNPWLKENIQAYGLQPRARKKWDLMVVTFLGQRPDPDGCSYNAYSLIVDKE